VDDGVELLVLGQTGADSQAPIEPFGDVLDRDFVAQGHVLTKVDVGGVVAPLAEQLVPIQRGLALVALAMNDDNRPSHFAASPR
jgi:hypothetical protein